MMFYFISRKVRRNNSLLTNGSMKIKIENSEWEDSWEEDEENVKNCNKKARLGDRPWWWDDAEEEEEEQEEENDEADFIKIKDIPDGLIAIFHEEVDRRWQKKPPNIEELRAIIFKQRNMIQNGN